MVPGKKAFEQVERAEERITDPVVHLSVPQESESKELADDHLQQLAAGAGTFLLTER